MTKPEAEQIARLLQQFHAAFGFMAIALLPANRQKTVDELLKQVPQTQQYGGVIFGFAALAFVQTYDTVYKELAKPASMTSLVDLSRFNVTVNAPVGPETNQEAFLRHLRNSFAHGRFTITVAGNVTTVNLHDQDRAGATTLAARCDAQDLLDLAERLLIAAHGEAAARA